MSSPRLHNCPCSRCNHQSSTHRRQSTSTRASRPRPQPVTRRSWPAIADGVANTNDDDCCQPTIRPTMHSTTQSTVRRPPSADRSGSDCSSSGSSSGSDSDDDNSYRPTQPRSCQQQQQSPYWQPRSCPQPTLRRTGFDIQCGDSCSSDSGDDGCYPQSNYRSSNCRYPIRQPSPCPVSSSSTSGTQHHRQQEQQQQQRSQPQPMATVAITNSDTNSTRSTVSTDRSDYQSEHTIPCCAVCFEPLQVQKQAVVIVPCYHASVCYDCAMQVKSQHRPCPVCRGVITAINKLYF